MENRFSFKEFEKVRLKAIYEIKIGDRLIEPGETIAVFDKIQIARINEEISRVSANGGFDNRPRVIWESVRDETLNFSQGVFSSTQFALMANSHMVELKENESISITKEEVLESDENGIVTLAQTPSDTVWIYNKQTGEKITSYTLENKTINIATPFLDVVVIYSYDYIDGAKVYELGQQLITGFVALEGQTRVKDDITGQITTGILKIPKLKLMSNLSITLGAQANPVVGNFSAVAVPVGSRGNTYISEFYLLNSDIDSDL